MEITLDRDLRSYIQKYLDHQTNNIDDSLFQKTIIENHKKITDPDLVGLIFSFLEENCFDSGELFHLFYLKKIEIEEPEFFQIMLKRHNLIKTPYLLSFFKCYVGACEFGYINFIIPALPFINKKLDPENHPIVLSYNYNQLHVTKFLFEHGISTDSINIINNKDIDNIIKKVEQYNISVKIGHF